MHRNHLGVDELERELWPIRHLPRWHILCLKSLFPIGEDVLEVAEAAFFDAW